MSISPNFNIHIQLKLVQWGEQCIPYEVEFPDDPNEEERRPLVLTQYAH